MEAAALFYLAAHARAAGGDVRAACILTVGDVPGEDVTIAESYLPLDELDRVAERMIEVALEAGTAPPGRSSSPGR
ncbi:MAG: hypothetical protein A2X23_09290 [Chloroflexi bacterium GWC2_73_18]|nr:MAG: hypothetical protein A2X23_09290 [Chloroflexi bacterium GWC2_73_18]